MPEQFPWQVVNLVLNTILVVGGGIVSFFLRGMRDTITKLETTDVALSAKVAAIEVMIAGNYVTRGEFQHDLDQLSSALFRKLDIIDTKLDKKADK